MTKKLEWEEARCPICGKLYSCIKGSYKPSTCNNFDCLYKYLHKPQFKEGGDSDFQQKIDEARRELRDKL